MLCTQVTAVGCGPAAGLGDEDDNEPVAPVSILAAVDWQPSSSITQPGRPVSGRPVSGRLPSARPGSGRPWSRAVDTRPGTVTPLAKQDADVSSAGHEHVQEGLDAQQGYEDQLPAAGHNDIYSDSNSCSSCSSLVTDIAEDLFAAADTSQDRLSHVPSQQAVSNEVPVTSEMLSDAGEDETLDLSNLDVDNVTGKVSRQPSATPGSSWGVTSASTNTLCRKPSGNA